MERFYSSKRENRLRISEKGINSLISHGYRRFFYLAGNWRGTKCQLTSIWSSGWEKWVQLYLYTPISIHRQGKVVSVHTMRAYRGEVQLHSFLNSALHGGEWWAPHPSHFTSYKRVTSTQRIRGWVGPPPVDLDRKKAPAGNRTTIPRLSTALPPYRLSFPRSLGLHGLLLN